MWSLDHLASNPRKIFIVDGFGAIVSAFMLGTVLTSFEAYFGIPTSSLLVLACVPLFFLIFDIFAYSKASKLEHYMRIIAILNLSYCILSFGYAVFHRDSITALGWLYIAVEITIIVGIALIELSIANRLRQNAYKVGK